ncbi:MAG TPA: 50S ribosomal protein L6 [Chloroflexota bacterium]|nr:50S ribosomal protein L6 [Chloroflexota bacterium]
MSRIGRQPITVPPGVQVQISEENYATVKGPKGQLERQLPPSMIIDQEDGHVFVKRPNEQGQQKALHGLTRTLLANMVEGVTQGFKKTLDITGVGYRATKQGEKVNFALGYSHPVEFTPPPGVRFASVETFTPTTANEWLSSRLVVEGIDKELVGATAAKVRSLRPVEPYKGKGIRYHGEVVRRKAGKAAGKGKGAK